MGLEDGNERPLVAQSGHQRSSAAPASDPKRTFEISGYSCRPNRAVSPIVRCRSYFCADIARAER